MKLTRQGVRDLNGYKLDGRQTNQRRRTNAMATPGFVAAFCEHDWRHSRSCAACTWLAAPMFQVYDRPPHQYVCIKPFCGATSP